MAVAAELTPGATLASYTIEAVLGRGGMSVVYAAFDERLGRQVALKLVGPSEGGTDELRERFLRESRLAASLDHPHVVPIYEAGEAAGSLFIAMRLVRGADLRNLLAHQGPLEPERALTIVSQTASALDAAHARGLLHRDVKPGNILLARDEQGAEHVYLSDFGLAIPGSGVEGTLERSRFHGTAEYAAPEQIQGHPEARSDVYSLGCVLFECLAGEPPFGRKRLLSTLWAHLNEPIPSVSERCPHLPAGLDDVLARALAKDPSDRYATSGELVADARFALGLDRLRPKRRVIALVAAATAAIAVAALATALLRGGEPPARSRDSGVISSLAGSGEVLPHRARRAPWTIAVSPNGSLYVAGSDAVERIDRGGNVTTVAGTGEYGYSGDGGPATQARIAGDVDLAFDSDGRLHILQTYRPALRRVDQHGVIETIAGTGVNGLLDDGPGTVSRDLCGAPVGPAFDADGTIYLICRNAHRVIRIDREGVYRTVAGTARAGYAGDEGPAEAAQLNQPSGIAIDREGNLYIADAANHRVRRVDERGIITTVAGTGEPGLSGDGWRATAVDLWQPTAVEVDDAGNLYVVEAGTHRVRKVDRSGVITTVAGTGVAGFGGDGGPADEAALNTPEEVAVDAEGNVYISDRGNGRIRVVRAPG